jgi:hypothetical protein
MAELSPTLISQMHEVRENRKRNELERQKIAARTLKLVKQAAATGASARSYAPELGLSDQTVRDMLKGRYGQGRPRGRPAKS